MGVLRGIELKCRERGQDILLSPMNEDDPNFDFLRPYRQRKVDGMIYVGLRQMPEEMRNEIARRLVITSYSIHYTKLYEEEKHPARNVFHHRE